MGIKQLYNDNLRKLPNEYGDVSVRDVTYAKFEFEFPEDLDTLRYKKGTRSSYVHKVSSRLPIADSKVAAGYGCRFKT